jgi:hypothetical protein
MDRRALDDPVNALLNAVQLNHIFTNRGDEAVSKDTVSRQDVLPFLEVGIKDKFGVLGS